MTRDTVICFRTSDNLRKALEKFSEADRRSLSSTIENILYAYVEEREPRRAEGERRRYPRKRISAPALVTGPDGAVHAGMVKDISLGGIHISLPRDFQCEVRDDARLAVVFTLPDSTKPLTIQCLPRHVNTDGQTNIGASFLDTDFQSYRVLQDNLMAQ
jgi:hypothetical protein